MPTTARFNKFAAALSSILTVLFTIPALHAAGNGIIAYPCRLNSTWQNLCYVNPDGSGAIQVTAYSDAGAGLPSWSPDGKKLTFVQQDLKSGIGFINTMNKDGTNLQTLATGGTPMWSPDGKSIAFATARNNTGTSEIWLMNADGSNQRPLTNRAFYNKTHPTWSPDGSSIAYAQYTPGMGHVSIWVMSASGANQHQLTTGNWVNRDANGNIINGANDANAPDWGASNKIAFFGGTENDGIGGQIWTINPNGSGRTQLTKVRSSNNDDPEWSPDGKQLLFSTNRNNGLVEMWGMNADGSGQHLIIVNSPSPLPGDAAWQPIP